MGDLPDERASTAGYAGSERIGQPGGMADAARRRRTQGGKDRKARPRLADRLFPDYQNQDVRGRRSGHRQRRQQMAFPFHAAF